jgi:hypothetical protein
VIQGTADAAGKPFTATSSVSGGSGTLGSYSAVTANSGPAVASVAANYSTGSLPTTGDTLIFDNSAASMLYDLSALSAVTLAYLKITGTFIGQIGLPNTAGTGSSIYREYRPTYFQIGATTCAIGIGPGNGSGRIKIDFGTAAYNCTVWNSASGLENDVPAVLIKGTHASANSLTGQKGSVGVAYFADEVAVLRQLNVGFVNNMLGDSSVWLGSGATGGIGGAGLEITQSGGTIYTNNNFINLNQTAGILYLMSGASITGSPINIGGTLIDYGGGTLDMVNLIGTYDHSQGLTASTITTLWVYKKAVYNDPYHLVTLTNGMSFSADCEVGDITLNVAAGTKLTF